MKGTNASTRVQLVMSMPSTLLHASDFYRVEMLFGGRTVRVVRQPKPFTSARDVETACEPVQAALDAVERSTHTLLVDSRAVVGRNDPASEQAFAAHRRRMLHGFRAAALLMQTATGKLQGDRLLREQELQHVRVVLREDEALLFLERDSAP